MTKPGVRVIGLGGTVAMTDRGEGLKPTLSAADLVAAVPQLKEHAAVEAEALRALPGAHLGFADVIELVRMIASVPPEIAGVVITQGTDTIEETAFLLDVLVDLERPVVVTGAMRSPTQPGSDGPANLLSSVLVAASPQARGAGTLVVMNDEIHAARAVKKTHATSPAAFRSPAVGPVGSVIEERVHMGVRPTPWPHVEFAELVADATVGLLKVGFDDDGRLVEAAAAAGFDGLVVEAMGAGHVPPRVLEALEEPATRIPVVIASRTGAGITLRLTYGFPGSERDLESRGMIVGNTLDGLKSRLLLTLLLRSGRGRDQIHDEADRWFRCPRNL